MTPDEILEAAYQQAVANIGSSVIENQQVIEYITVISQNIRNRAGVRLVMSCLLAKLHNPDIDVRKPYTEIGDEDAFSGRSYDEQYLSGFIEKYDLPCNPTTAFLTPALRNRDTVLTPDIDLVGRPKEVYNAALQLLTDAHLQIVTVEDMLVEIIRQLLVLRNQKRERMASLLANLKPSNDTSLSSEAIVTLLQQHLASKGSSRLPVLIIAAIYKTIEEKLGEKILPLEAHNAADRQTGALGDLQVILSDDKYIITAYEMKAKRVEVHDIDVALRKIAEHIPKIDNYIFVTTDTISHEIYEYAVSIYEQIGIEIAILDCIEFVRYFLHLFYRVRIDFLDNYQALVLAEPDSAVSQPLKEVFLALRQTAESDE